MPRLNKANSSVGNSSMPTGYGGSFRNESINEQYYDKLFKDTDYYDLYRSIINSYDVAPPTSFFGHITGKNATNAYNHEMSKRDELNALVEKMYNENYNSPLEDVERLRAAGLNPDLTGLSGASASPTSPNGIPQNVAAENGVPIIQSAVGVLLNVVGIAKTFVDGYFHVDSMLNQKAINELNLIDKANSTAESMVMGSPYLFSDNPLDVSSDSIRASMKLNGVRGRRASRYVQDAIGRVVNNPELFSRYKRARVDSMKLSSEETAIQPIMEALGKLIGLEMQTSLQSQIDSNKAKSAESEYNLNFFDSLDGATQAFHKNAESGYYGNYFSERKGKQAAELDNIIDEIDLIMRDALSSIGKQSAKDKDPLGVMFYYIMSWFLKRK